MLKAALGFWAPVLIFLLTLAFFAKLLLTGSIYATPDYGRSDFINFNIPVKYFLAQSIKNQQLPLWQPEVGQGFPFFDEGQIGFFYLPNLILFRIFPLWLAFDLGYIVTFTIAGLGTYLLARSLNLNKPASYLAGITYAFSPALIIHVQHYNLIQTAAIVPWLFYLINSFFASKKLLFLILIPIFISQQLFAGFPQYPAYTVVFITIFFFFKTLNLKTPKVAKFKIFSFFIAMLILAAAIASFQLAATYRLTQQSQRTSMLTPNSILSDFPFKPINLLTLLNPSYFGTPKDASYPTWIPGYWGLFWEGNAYFGIVQLIISSGFVIAFFINKKKDYAMKEILFWVGLGILGILLSLGKYAPLHPLFSLPPFSIFRVPSRLLFLTFLSAAVISGFAVDKLFKLKSPRLAAFVVSVILVLATADIFRLWSNFQLTTKASVLLSRPSIITNIDPQKRIMSALPTEIWNSTYKTKGWQNQQSSYLFYKNSLAANSNILWGISNADVYAGLMSRRSQIVYNLKKQDIEKFGDFIHIGNVSQKSLDFTSVSYLTSFNPVISKAWKLIGKAASNNQYAYLYQNLEALPQVYAVNDYSTASSIQEVISLLNSKDFDPHKTVILETKLQFEKSKNNTSNEVSIQNYQNTKVTVSTNLKSNAIVVLSDSYYPNWHAYIDGQETKILPANINSRAIIVPEGQHQIVYMFKLDSLTLWAKVSLLSLLLWLFLFFKTRKLTA